MRLTSKLKLLTAAERAIASAVGEQVKIRNVGRFPQLMRSPDRAIKRWLRTTAKARGAERSRRAHKAARLESRP